MIVDTSALVALLFKEDVAEDVWQATEGQRLAIAAPTLVELGYVIEQRLGPAARGRVNRLLNLLEIEVVPFTAEHADLARQGLREYGRATGSPARLNLGDSFSYALAAQTGEPLLFVGQDFTYTDVTPALGSGLNG